MWIVVNLVESYEMEMNLSLSAIGIYGNYHQKVVRY